MEHFCFLYLVAFRNSAASYGIRNFVIFVDYKRFRTQRLFHFIVPIEMKLNHQWWIRNGLIYNAICYTLATTKPLDETLSLSNPAKHVYVGIGLNQNYTLFIEEGCRLFPLYWTHLHLGIAHITQENKTKTEDEYWLLGNYWQVYLNENGRERIFLSWFTKKKRRRRKEGKKEEKKDR